MPTPEFKVNTKRYDPYKNFNFRVMWDGKYVAGVSTVSGLTRTTQVITHREGGDPTTPRRSPGQSEYAPITLERGVTHDMAFEEWANKVWSYTNSLKGNFPSTSQVVSLKDFRKDVIVLHMFNEAGQLAIAYNIYRAWVSSYEATPDLDAMGNAVAIQSLTIENEGWERDNSVTEPTEPQFDSPSKTP